MKKLDLTGQRFARLLVLSFDSSANGHRYWNCVCDCGNSVVVEQSSLVERHTKSCGCLRRENGRKSIPPPQAPEDLTGKIFSRLTAIKIDKEGTKQGKTKWFCKCECGKTVSVLAMLLKSGGTRSCGCLALEVQRQTGKNSKGRVSSKRKDLTGMRFTRLFVESFHDTSNGTVRWNCLCDCGKRTIVSTGHLLDGHTKSCGCLGLERATKAKITHGLAHTPIYNVHRGMLARCYSKSCGQYKWYGAKGIIVCDEWKDFESFNEWATSHGYKEGLTIDRIDPNKNYCPENCEWVTRSENSRRMHQTRKQKSK